MKFHTIKYDPSKIITGSVEYKKLHKETSIANVVYFFYKDGECLYIGETGTSLADRIFKHSPKHRIQPWFNEGNIIFQIELDSCIDDIARETIEATFILAYRPKYNQKA